MDRTWDAKGGQGGTLSSSGYPNAMHNPQDPNNYSVSDGYKGGNGGQGDTGSNTHFSIYAEGFSPFRAGRNNPNGPTSTDQKSNGYRRNGGSGATPWAPSIREKVAELFYTGGNGGSIHSSYDGGDGGRGCGGGGGVSGYYPQPGSGYHQGGPGGDGGNGFLVIFYYD